jgi:hypothetical protein
MEVETSKQFAWFKAYRDLPAADRTVSEAYRRKSGKLDAVKAPSWLYEVSTLREWRKRATAYDHFLDRMQYESEIEERIRVRRTRRAILLSAMDRAGKALPHIDIEGATAGELARLLDVTARNLREEYADTPDQKQTVTVVNGGTTEHAQLADRADTLSDAELVAEYRRLTAAAASSRPLAGGATGVRSGFGDGVDLD